MTHWFMSEKGEWVTRGKHFFWSHFGFSILILQLCTLKTVSECGCMWMVKGRCFLRSWQTEGTLIHTFFHFLAACLDDKKEPELINDSRSTRCSFSQLFHSFAFLSFFLFFHSFHYSEILIKKKNNWGWKPLIASSNFPDRVTTNSSLMVTMTNVCGLAASQLSKPLCMLLGKATKMWHSQAQVKMAWKSRSVRHFTVQAGGENPCTEYSYLSLYVNPFVWTHIPFGVMGLLDDNNNVHIPLWPLNPLKTIEQDYPVPWILIKIHIHFFPFKPQICFHP